MPIKESGENYLEAVLNIEERNGIVRPIDVANELNVSKPSVSRAMRVLKKTGYIEQEAYGDITLTELGREKANEIWARHRIITEFLTDILKVSPKTAEQDACRIEHVISFETLARMRVILGYE